MTATARVQHRTVAKVLAENKKDLFLKMCDYLH